MKELNEAFEKWTINGIDKYEELLVSDLREAFKAGAAYGESKHVEYWSKFHSTVDNRDKEIKGLRKMLAIAIGTLEELERFQVLTRQDIGLPMEIASKCLDEIEEAQYE